MVMVIKAVAILLAHLHVPGPNQYGAGPPCNDNPLHQLCVGTGPLAYHPSGTTWQSVVAIIVLALVACLILAFCIGHALKSRGKEERGWL